MDEGTRHAGPTGSGIPGEGCTLPDPFRSTPRGPRRFWLVDRSWGALCAAALVVALTPPPAAARPAALPDRAAPSAQAGQDGRAHGAARARREGRAHGKHGKHRKHRRHGVPAGTDQHVGAALGRKAQAERDVALAAAWRLDPELLEPRATDSEATAEARRQLGDVYHRLGDAMDAYDRARTAAATAAVESRDARTALIRARELAAAASVVYERDRALYAAVITEAYQTGSVGALGMLFSADSDQDLVTGMMMLQELNESQAEVVLAAERSRNRLAEATVAVAVADGEARDRLEAARTALTEAEAARSRVVAGVGEARAMLEDSVLADRLAAIRASSAGAAAAAAAAVGMFVEGGARVSFPLPAGATFVDQDNWGHRSRHWARVHTGDDFSTACGTPVLAVTDGTVSVRTDQSWSGPWLVTITSGEGSLTTWYAHMAALLVVDGTQVEAGQPIGVVGAEGNATGCHLHFEVHPTAGSIYEDDTDPVGWLRAVGVYPSPL